ncbi:MAG: diguanylate cyclase [Acholeplasmataceae bacterium]
MDKKIQPIIVDQTEFLESIFNKFVDPLFIVDPKTYQILSSNAAATTIYGFDHTSFLKMSFLDLCIDKSKFNDVNLENRHFKLKCFTKSKMILDVHVSQAVLVLDGRSVLLLFCVIEDEHTIQQFLSRGVFYQLPEASVFIDTNYQIIAINNEFKKMFLFNEEETANQNLLDLILPLKRKKGSRSFTSIFNGSTVSEYEAIKYDKNGKPLNVKVYMIPKYLNEEIIGAQVIYKNLQAAKTIELNLKFFQTIVEKHLDGVIIQQEDGTIMWINKAVEKMFGYTEKELVGHNIAKLRSNYHEEEFYELFVAQRKAKGYWRGEIFNKHKNGSINPYWLKSFSISDEASNSKSFISIYKDLYGKELFNQKLLLSLQKDPLTLLYNRTYFVEKIEQILQEHHNDNHILAFIDLDNFKIYNDENGHLLGDRLLAEFAKRVAKHFNNVLTARFGGDEFVVFYRQEADTKKIEQEINLFNTNLSVDPIIVDGKRYYIQTSFGIALYPNEGKNVYDLLDVSDKKMYFAKKQ